MAADDPADFDPDEARADEWSKPDAATVADGVPLPVEETTNTPRPEVTGNHRISQAEFVDAVELADRDAYRRGDAHGYARGLAEGRALVSAEDWEDGVECALRGLKVFLAAQSKQKFTIDEAEAFAGAVRPFVKRGG